MIKDNPRITKKEQGLIKGSLRRVFSRSEIRLAAIAKVALTGHRDANRPRVTKWSLCPACNKKIPTYKMAVDHILPLIPVDTSLEFMTWDEVVNRLWCVVENLNAICPDCHDKKTALERKARTANKREAKKSKKNT